MKLRNKKTGEIVEICKICPEPYGARDFDCKSLSELNEEWEDYEEPEEYWYMENNGDVDKETYDGDDYEERMKEIGNYFSTEEEAEKTVEKLKAWKRLKDKGAEFYGWRRNQTGTYELYLRWEDRIPRSHEVKNDLDLLFGVEE